LSPDLNFSGRLASERNFIRCSVAPFEVVLAKHLLGDQIGRPDKIAWIITGKTFLDPLAALIMSHANHFPGLQ
jgi:hypothetical protein